MLLASRGADPARHRLGYSLSPCLRMGIFPRAATHRGRTAPCHAGCLRAQRMRCAGVRASGARIDDEQANACAGGESTMSRVVFKLPDLGEGTVEAEIVAWRVKPGDSV